MKTLLTFFAGMAAIASYAQPLAPASPAAPSKAGAQKTAPPTVPLRQLSAEERAQLRRQLSDYSRVAGKGS